VATVLTGIITPALQACGQVSAGESPTAAEQADCLIALNAMVTGLNNEGLMAYTNEEQTLTVGAGDASYTIGTSGDVNTTRPVKILAAWGVDGSSVSQPPMRIIDDDEYAAISDKTTEADWPTRLLYRPSVGASAHGTIILWPVPNATRTVKLLVRVPITTFAAVSTDLVLPPGWEEMYMSNFCVRIAPIFETSAPPDIKELARISKANIKRTNMRPMKAYTELPALLGQSCQSNILSGP
jgi:hypothetical protein